MATIVRVLTQRSFLLILIFVVVALVGLRVAGITSKNSITHDEGISYLAATGHQGEYANAVSNLRPPVGTWVEAARWKQFVSVDKRFAFRQIGKDLAEVDIHPPLYFWLLHIWAMIFGVHEWTGPSLNILIVLATAALLFRLARYVLGNEVKAALVTLIWAVSPAVIAISFTARQYGLLALVTTLFVDQIIRYTRSPDRLKSREIVLLSILTAAGLLTHYHFLLVVAGAAVFWSVCLARANTSRWISGLASLSVGFILFFALHPGFYNSFQIAQGQAGAFGVIELGPRVGRVVEAIWSFVLPCSSELCNSGPSPWSLILIVQAAILLALAPFLMLGGLKPYIFRSLLKGDQLAGLEIAQIGVAFFLAWLTGAVLVAYVLNFGSPIHAMGAQYLSMTWPFLAMLIVLRLPTPSVPSIPGNLVLALLGIGIILTGSMSVYNYMSANLDKSDPGPLLRSSNVLLVDNLSRGFFPRAYWYVPNDTLVFATNQRRLIDAKQSWICGLKESSIYISGLTPGAGSSGNSPELQKEIVKLLESKYEVTFIEGGVWGVGSMYRMLPRSEVNPSRPLTDANEVPCVTVADVSGNENHGLLVNEPYSVSGKIDAGVGFDGIDDYISLADVHGFEDQTPFTVSLWAKDSGASGRFDRVVSKESLGGPREGWLLFRHKEGDKYGFERWEEGKNEKVVMPYTTGQWNHVAFTYDGTFLRGYLNGVLAAGPVPSSIRIQPVLRPLTVGALGNGGPNFYDGEVDDLRIYGRALSEEDLAELAQTLEPGPGQSLADSLVGHWKFDELLTAAPD